MMRKTARPTRPLAGFGPNNPQELANRKLFPAFVASAALLASGCSGGGGAGALITPNVGDGGAGAITSNSGAGAPTTSNSGSVGSSNAQSIMPQSAVPSTSYRAVASLGMTPLADRPVFSVKHYGATGNGVTDDTTAIQSAFNHVPSGAILTFPSGTYIHSDQLVLSTPNVILEGTGGILKGTNADREAIVIVGNKTAIVNMTIQGAGGSIRKTTEQAHLIDNKAQYVQIVGNTLSGSSAATIFDNGATDFRVTGNHVSGGLADGIHSTHKSQRGLIESNTVYGTGDDMIAVVSYRSDPGISGHILINNNNVNGNNIPSGRGITCVGCDTVAITNNTVKNVLRASGIYISQEPRGAGTVGVNGVLVKNNTVSNAQYATYSGDGQQGGIDVNTADVAPYYVHYVSIENNTVTNVGYDGIRVIGEGATRNAYDPAYINLNTNTVTNYATQAPVDTFWKPFKVFQDFNAPSTTTCWNLTANGVPYTVPSGSNAGCTVSNITSAAWTQFNFANPQGTTWQ